MWTILSYTIYMLSSLFHYLIPTAYAATVKLTNPLGTEDFATLVNRIGEYLVKLGIVVATLMVVIGGFQILVAGSNSERLKSGKDTIKWALIGLVILLIGKGFVSLIQDILGTP